MTKYLYWGPHPWEKDGGAVVNYYNLLKQNELRPRDEYWGLPKVYEEYDGSALPWVNVPPFMSTEQIPQLMMGQEIPLLNIFHIGPVDFEKIIGPVHSIGGKIVLHQTIHWPDDTVLKSEMLNEFDMIVAPTMYAYRIFQTLKNISPEKLRYIPHGVDTDKFQKRPTILERKFGKKKGQKVILYSGRLSFWKGVHQIIPIMRPLIKEYDPIFIIRGGYFWGEKEGKALAHIFTRMSKNNPNIFFLPEWQPPAFMEELYAMTDILLFPSGHEGFGVPLIEIQAVEGVPVTTALANHTEILGRNGYVGLLMEPTKKVGEVNDGTPIKVPTSDQIYGQVKWLLENPDEAEIMGRRGRQNVLERFDLTKVCRQWLELYDEMIPEDYNMDMAMRDKLLE